jgi:hypothetical protein
MTQQSVKHQGGCLCGEVRFEARGYPRAVFHCHCASCRRHNAAVVATFAVFPTAPEWFRWQGRSQPGRYQSSSGVTRSFCRQCGTPLSYQAEKYPGEIHLNIGAFDHAEALEPTAHFFTAEKVSWFDTADSLPRYPHGSADSATAEESWGGDEA